MSKVKIEFDCNNAFFGESEFENREAISIILDHLSLCVYNNGLYNDKILDGNGNSIGDIKFIGFKND